MNDPLGFDILHNFISPVTGRVLATTNYVLMGDSQGIATPSPILIDIRLDLNALKKRYNTLVMGDFVIGHPNHELPAAQVLVNLADGFMFNTAGIVSTTMIVPIGSLPDLPENNIWIGDATNRPVPQQRVKLLNLPSFLSANPTSNFGLLNLYTGQTFSLTSLADAATPTTTLRIDMSNTPNLSVGKMWIGVSNPTPPTITFDGTFPYVHIVGSLNWDLTNGVANEIGLNPGELFIGSTDPLKVGQITTTTTLTLVNFPDLTYKSIWRGDITNRPVESTDLTTAESNISTLQSDVLALQADVTTINGEILVLQGQVAAIDVTLYTPVTGLVSVVAGLVTTVAGLSTTVAGLVTAVATNTASIATLFTLSARTLDQIPLAAADVDINNNKLINVNDPVNPKDAVNLETLNTVSSRTLDQIPLAVADVNINNHKLINVNDPTNLKDAVNLETLNTVSSRTLDQIPLAAADVNINNHKLTNVNDPTNLKDAVNLETLNTVSSRTLDQIPLAAANVDINNHRLINVSDPVNVKDAVNLETLNTAIAGAGTVTSVTGTTNQITVVNNTTTPVVSLPAAVQIATSLTVGGTTSGLELISNNIQSFSNNNINITPNGTGNIIFMNSNPSLAVGVRMNPTYCIDAGGTIRATRFLGNPDPTLALGQGEPPSITLGAVGVVGTGATSSIIGTSVSGTFTITTGTGILTAGLIATFTFVFAMPSSTYTILYSSAAATSGSVSGTGVGLYITSISASQFTFTAGGTLGLTASTTYKWNYIIFGY